MEKLEMFRQRKWSFSWTLNYKLEVRLRKALSVRLGFSQI